MIPAEKRTEAEMLHDGELGEDFCIVHFDHAFVDFAPSCPHARDVIQHGRVLPERALFDVVDEADGAEIHVFVTLSGYGCGFRDGGWVWRALERSFGGGLGGGCYGWAVLGAAEDVGDEGVVV